MSKKIVEDKNKKNSKKMILAIRIIKSKKSGFYTFENKIITDNEVDKFFHHKDKN
ncbi:DUF4295 domain-containing protein [Blattabacterium sp. (Cryptocercus kyebangensis)]|uniref:DUF4295 family protein n=1 Tax=Blattabacterium sp. (Cryptocercus kyebangensis) TaxID=298656 RepID=UPI000D7C18B6|nr:DUF4295 family protein [Blattabacterium sp. (Cryptocercus kyebangensis)]AWU43903.1 DUF4295 domain-containing protein [Blattabacterium sp. (Cryptocercus kyebangensis)]